MAQDSKAGGSENGSTGDKLLMRALGPAADELGQELAPLGKEVGEIGVRAARALLRPLRGLVWGYEQIEVWVAESLAPKIEKVPPEHRVEPKLIVAGPLLDSMKYAGAEPHLRDLFASLLATSMDARTASTAHPAFVEMVKQLSPNEAKLLRYISRTIRNEDTSEIRIGYSVDSQPILAVTVIKIVKTGYDHEEGTDNYCIRTVFGPYTAAAVYAGCEHLTLVPSYLNNLVRLEIIRIEKFHTPSFRLAGQLHAYEEEHQGDPLISRLMQEAQSGSSARADMVGHRIEVTPLGEQFLNACVR